MSHYGTFNPVAGYTVKESWWKRLVFLLVGLLAVPLGGYITWGKWMQGEFSLAGIGIAAAGVFCTGIGVLLLYCNDRLVIGNECFQVIRRQRVIRHIPYKNIVLIMLTKDSSKNKLLGVLLHDVNDPETFSTGGPSDFEAWRSFDGFPFFFVDTYAVPLADVRDWLQRALDDYRASGSKL